MNRKLTLSAGGNPIAIVAKQIDMKLQKIRSRCPIYDWTGNPVSFLLDTSFVSR